MCRSTSVPGESRKKSESQIPRIVKLAHSRGVQREERPTKFSYTTSRELHSERRRKILEKYPEIIRLYGYDVRSAVFCVGTILFQLFMAFWVSEMESFPALLALTYAVSGTLNHSLLLAMHEVTHDLFFKQRWANQLLAVLANLPMGVPASNTFRVYHAEHHSGMGEEGVDTDIPTEFEAWLFRGVAGRMVWLVLQPVFYAVRPMLMRPKRKSFGTWLAIVLQVSFDILVLVFLGWKSFMYLFGGTLLGTGLHPLSGHFVAEHFEFVKGQETYSYYGPLNWLTYNVGYHNEHHDFPKIPGSRLPKVKEIAAEFYSMPCYTSWTKVIMDFIIGRNMNLYGRVKRVPPPS